jgi:putative flippase GtrA
LIPERHRSLIVEIVTFGAVGAINTALGQLLFNIFLHRGALTANTISTAIATVCSFVLNRHVTYRHRPKTALRRELPLFALLNLIGFGIQQAIIAGATHAFNLQTSDRIELNAARFGAVIVGTIFLLLTYRTFVFKKAPAEQVAAAADAAMIPPPAPEPVLEPTHVPEMRAEFTAITDGLEDELDPIEDEPATTSAR